MKYLTLILLLLPAFLYAQFTDDFSDGDFTALPVWSGETANFEVDGSFKLHLDAPAVTDESYLSTSSQAILNASWEFYVEMDFNTSNDNQAFVYLVSNNADLEGPVNGYCVRLGSTADEISLYRQDGSTRTEIIDGVDDKTDVSFNNIRVRVTRDDLGNWELLTDTSGGTSFVSEGTVFDDAHQNNSFFGVLCDYTQTRSDKFWFDDFSVSGTFFTDTIKPRCDSFVVKAIDTLEIFFSETVDSNLAKNTANYTIDNGIGNPASIQYNHFSNQVLLILPSSLQQGTAYTLTISNVEDLAGNLIVNNPKSFGLPAASSIIINEFYPDPDSTITSLPNEEFIELYNSSSFPVDLNNWEIGDASDISSNSFATISSVVIPANGYVIITTTKYENRYSSFGITKGISSFPSLNNSGDELMLRDPLGNVVDYINYDENWYNNDQKSEGGYTIERIDPDQACLGSLNWEASNDPTGGSPGAVNSIDSTLEDIQMPNILRIEFVSASSFAVYFDESLDINTGVDAANYTIEPSIGNPAFVNFKDFERDAVFLSFSSPLSAGTIYTLTVSGITDCAGNSIGLTNTLSFGVPEEIEAGDIVINEILFNPYSEASDFVELYNRSNKVLSLENVFVFELDADDENNILDILQIDVGYLFLPREHLVLTEDRGAVLDNYVVENPNLVLETEGFPNYPNDDGRIVLIQGTLRIDDLQYSNDWHFDLIDNEDGISLERIDYELPTQDENNWHSAASDVGFATPSSINSQSILNPTSSNLEISIVPETFTPNLDGEDDFVLINYSFDKPGYVATVSVFDLDGRLVRVIAQSVLLSASGSFQWDGINDENKKAKVGIYVINFEVFDLDGNVRNVREKVVLSSDWR